MNLFSFFSLLLKDLTLAFSLFSRLKCRREKLCSPSFTPRICSFLSSCIVTFMSETRRREREKARCVTITFTHKRFTLFFRSPLHFYFWSIRDQHPDSSSLSHWECERSEGTWKSFPLLVPVNLVLSPFLATICAPIHEKICTVLGLELHNKLKRGDIVWVTFHDDDLNMNVVRDSWEKKPFTRFDSFLSIVWLIFPSLGKKKCYWMDWNEGRVTFWNFKEEDENALKTKNVSLPFF